MRVTLTKDTVTPALKKLQRELQFSSIGHSVGNIALADILRNFKTEGRNIGEQWEPLSKATIKARRKGTRKGRGVRILRDTGQMVNSIHFKVLSDSVEIRTNRIDKYGEDIAAKHHYGTKRIPRRPFMRLSNNAVREIKELPSQIIRRLQ